MDDGRRMRIDVVTLFPEMIEQAQKMMKMVAKGGVQKMVRGMRGMLPGMR